MFIIAQIPFVDFRLLSDKKYKDCFFPNNFDRDFEKLIYYRFLGSEKSRYNPNLLPMSERKFFDSKKILYVDGGNFERNMHYNPQLLFSRFFEDKYSFHFDVGIRQKVKSNESQYNLKKFARKILSCPFFGINHNFESEDIYYDFIGVCKKIKEIYLYATISKKAMSKDNYKSQIVLGQPALFIVYDKNENHFFGKAKEVYLENGIKVRHDLVSVKNTFVDVWYIGKEGLPKYYQDLRNLRIYLSKLHSYKETMRIMLNYLDNEKNKDLDSDKIRDFLEYMLYQMNRKKYYGYSNDDFWEVAFSVEKNYNYVVWNEFKVKVELYKRKYEMNASKVCGNGVVITGCNIVQSQINNQSKNNVMRMCTVKPEEIKEDLQEFEVMLERLIGENIQLTEEQKSLLQNQSETFEEYVVGKAPDKKFAHKLLEGVKSTLGIVLANAQGIQSLMEIGEKIVEGLK